MQNSPHLTSYLPVLLFFGVAFFLSIGLMALARLRGPKRPNSAKDSPYECGFDTLSDVRQRFDVQYALIAILFLLFDVEVVFLFPWAVQVRALGGVAFGVILGFLGILTVGLIYEWRVGALEWE